MRFVSILLFFAAILPAASATPPLLAIRSEWEWPQTLLVKCGLTGTGMEAFLVYHGTVPGSVSPAAQGARFAFGLSLPWLMVGPLAPSGLLREAANPLAFDPGSDVFIERTGLLPDALFPVSAYSLLIEPVPGILGLYCRSVADSKADSNLQLGGFSRMGTWGSSGLDALVSISAPSVASSGEEWYSHIAPYPGGRIASFAARFFWRSAGIRLGMTFGGSAGERVQPGFFLLAHGSMEWYNGSLSLLFGRAGREWRAGTGKGIGEAMKAAGALRWERPDAVAKLAYSLIVDQPRCFPGPFMETSEEVSLSLQRVLLRMGGLDLVGIVDAGKSIRFEAGGKRDGTGNSLASVMAKVGGFEGQAGVFFNDPGKGSLEAGLQISTRITLDAHGSRLSLEARISNREAEGPELTALCSARFVGQDRAFDLEAGLVEYAPDHHDPTWSVADIWRSFRFTAGWSVSSSFPVTPRAPFRMESRPPGSEP